jgi:hypothetical protein
MIFHLNARTAAGREPPSLQLRVCLAQNCPRMRVRPLVAHLAHSLATEVLTTRVPKNSACMWYRFVSLAQLLRFHAPHVVLLTFALIVAHDADD